MLKDYALNAVLATSDLERSRAWYADKLGWQPVRVLYGTVQYEVAGATFGIYETPNAGTAKNTVAIWRLTDLAGAIARLRARGVVFEEYDFGDVKTVDGVMTDPSDGTMNAWFADPDGNIWSLFEDPNESRPDGIGPMLAAADLERAKRWYAEQLGYAPEREFEGFVMVYESGGQRFSIYATQYAGTAKNTVAAWEVADLEAEMADLRARGVVFEEYDVPGLKTESGIGTLEDGSRGAWFTDSEGNILAIAQQARD